MNNVFLLTGGNVGNRMENLALAKQRIELSIGELVKFSAIYETAAWGITDQPAFLNQVLQVKTPHNPEELLKLILGEEIQMGRQRFKKYGPRIIDIDILFYNQTVIKKPHLVIPHPEIQNRRFVLSPLAEICPKFLHPVFNKTIETLLAECPDPLQVSVYKT